MKRLRIQRLAASDIAKSFPLIQLAVPEMTLEAWCDYARESLYAAPYQDRGILAVIDGRSYILGLADYFFDRHVDYGRSLIVKNIVAVDLIERNRNEVASLLLTSLADMAEERGCHAIFTEVPGPHSAQDRTWMIPLLEAQGHQPAPIRFCKALG